MLQKVGGAKKIEKSKKIQELEKRKLPYVPTLVGVFVKKCTRVN
jgi:hypothetical protein